MNTTDITPAEAIRAVDRLRRLAEDAHRNVSRPGKRISADEKDRRRAIARQADQRLARVLNTLDPDRPVRMQRMAVDVEAETAAIIRKIEDAIGAAS